MAGPAAVSREWQTVIKYHNFARIHLAPPRLADFGSMIHRNRAVVRYVWLRLELDKYDCAWCAPEEMGMWGLSNKNNTLIVEVLQHVFSTLSSWEPNGDLLLDINVHSPSDSEHWFKYLIFGPDVPPDECEPGRYAEKPMLAQFDDHKHGWIGGSRTSAPNDVAINEVFDEIMGEGSFVDDEQENQWWQKLPLVPAVRGVLLRQQTRRR